MKVEIKVKLILTISLALLAVFHIGPILNYYRMNKKLDGIQGDAGFTIGSVKIARPVGKSFYLDFSYLVGNETVSSSYYLTFGNIIARYCHVNLDLDKNYLVLYKKSDHEKSVVLTCYPIEDSSSVNQYVGKKLRWGLYEGLYFE